VPIDDALRTPRVANPENPSTPVGGRTDGGDCDDLMYIAYLRSRGASHQPSEERGRGGKRLPGLGWSSRTVLLILILTLILNIHQYHHHHHHHHHHHPKDGKEKERGKNKGKNLHHGPLTFPT
jgi:hypothetical protein